VTPVAALERETDAMRAEADVLGIPDTVEGLLAYLLREVAALRIGMRVAMREVDELRVKVRQLEGER
jgi:hypothetical protein